MHSDRGFSDDGCYGKIAYFCSTIMSALICKSKENMLASGILIENKCYASSVHCSYYSSFQLMLHLLLSEYSFTQETIRKQGTKGTHIFASEKIRREIDNKNKRSKSLEFHREIGMLKNKRVQADYRETEINAEFSNDAMHQAIKINNILVEVFKIEL